MFYSIQPLDVVLGRMPNSRLSSKKRSSSSRPVSWSSEQLVLGTLLRGTSAQVFKHCQRGLLTSQPFRFQSTNLTPRPTDMLECWQVHQSSHFDSVLQKLCITKMSTFQQLRGKKPVGFPFGAHAFLTWYNALFNGLGGPRFRKYFYIYIYIHLHMRDNLRSLTQKKALEIPGSDRTLPVW